MKDIVKVGLLGIGGYGDLYVSALLDAPADDSFQLVGVADAQPEKAARYADIASRGIPIHRSLESLCDASQIDLLILATPIHFHARQTCEALRRGISVLCEKPLAATFDQVTEIVQAEKRASRRKPGTFVGVGFQWSFSKAIAALKADINLGLLGAPVRFRAIALAPRPQTYYDRNGWAGRRFAKSGDPIFDSPVNNATSHSLHTMLHVLEAGTQMQRFPVEVTSELYRANPIETFDAAALRIRTGDGVEILFYTAHCVAEVHGPMFSYEFERATVTCSSAERMITARFHDGRTKHYGDPSADPMRKVWSSIHSVRTGGPIACSAADALPHAVCTSAAFPSPSAVHAVAPAFISLVETGDTTVRTVRGLDDLFVRSFLAGVLPNEFAGERPQWVCRAQTTPVQKAAHLPALKLTVNPSAVRSASAGSRSAVSQVEGI